MNVRSMTLALALLCATASTLVAKPDYPEVTLDYRPFFDNACADATNQPLNAEAVKELQSRLGEFQEFWRKESPHLLGTVPKVTRVPFRFREAKAALFVCSGFPSLSLPLLISTRIYLTASSKGPVTPLVDFSNNVMHEVLHRYVNDCLEALPRKTTPLLEKYSTEPHAVRRHLHLYAIMELVYRQLGRDKDLEVVFAAEQTFPRAWAISKRAREIIAEEKAESFARELRGNRRQAGVKVSE